MKEVWFSQAIEKLADYLIENGVIVLPCKVGSTIYRIDYISNPCSHEGVCYDEFYCRNCLLLECGACDYRKEPYIYKIENANAQTILGNEHLIGTRAFLTKKKKQNRS